MITMREWITRGIRTLRGCGVGLEQNEILDVEFSISKDDLDRRITENFKLKELVHSGTATTEGIPNLPANQEQIEALEEVALHILQPVRDWVNLPVLVTSGFRSPELNKRLGGSMTPPSQHTKGEAVDFVVRSFDTRELAKWIKKHLEFDQLILEEYEGGSSGWIHCSYVADGNRNECLTIRKDGTVARGIK